MVIFRRLFSLQFLLLAQNLLAGKFSLCLLFCEQVIQSGYGLAVGIFRAGIKKQRQQEENNQVASYRRQERHDFGTRGRLYLEVEDNRQRDCKHEQESREFFFHDR